MTARTSGHETMTLEEALLLIDEQQRQLERLAEIGTALSAEKDHDRLLEMIVTEAQRYTNADGCTLYIHDPDAGLLHFKILRNTSLGIKQGGGGDPIDWPPVRLRNPDGSENHANVSAHCALAGEIVRIADVYAADFDFSGTRRFDAASGYRSKSMLVLPMRDHQDEIIGVIQLLNATDRRTGEVVDFPDHAVALVAGLASQAAIAMTNNRLIQDLETLLEAIVKMVATAIDEKSPYTAGHVQRVAEVAEALARAVDECGEGRFAGERFAGERLQELRMAAWLHDVGKIVTPAHVIDKATKLETVFDRLELVRLRLELLRKDQEIAVLRRRLDGKGEPETGGGVECDPGELEAFLAKVNEGGEFLPDEQVARIEQLARMTIATSRGPEPLLTTDEVKNLSIRRGTLTPEEREIINNHVKVTERMLARLPFPRKLADVGKIAAMHHEKLDGSGYPHGLTGEEIPLAARILAVADVFEALTAADRPYKPGKKLSEVMRILGFMVKDNHLDGDLCDLLVASGFVGRYARKYLAERQIDAFEWRGRRYEP